MTDREAMQMALERLTMWLEDFPDTAVIEDRWAVDALRQALAQPEQEPVAYIARHKATGEFIFSNTQHNGNAMPDYFEILPVYTTPPRKEWVGLTDDERNEMIGRIQHDQYTRQRDLIGSTQIITEMYLKEKNNAV